MIDVVTMIWQFQYSICIHIYDAKHFILYTYPIYVLDKCHVNIS